MLSNKKEVAVAIMNLLATQEFDDWYKGRFNQWIEGDDNAPGEGEILHWITNHLH
jgi:hypothetical protein